MLLYTKGQRERPVSPQKPYVGKPTKRLRNEEYYLPGSIDLTFLGEMNMPQYTEGERNIQHYLKYGTYPPPPRQYLRQQGLSAGVAVSNFPGETIIPNGRQGLSIASPPTPEEAWRPRYTEDERNIRHLFRYGTYPPPPRQYLRRQGLGETTKQTSWAVIGGLLLAGLILCKIS